MKPIDWAGVGKIPDLKDHKPEEVDENGWTVAMILAVRGLEIPECWHHDPLLKNNYGYTVALL